MDEKAPLTGGMISAWTAGLSPENVGPTLVAVGTSTWHLSRWRNRDYDSPGFLVWTAPELGQAQGRGLSHPLLGSPALRWLREPHNSDLSYRGERGTPAQPLLRLALEGNAIPPEVVPRLLACPGVASVVLPVQRSPGALRRRPWQWPLRLGVLDETLLAELRLLSGDRDKVPQHLQHVVPAGLVEVVDVRSDPAPVGILVVVGPPAAAARLLSERPQVANAVLCVAPPDPEAWAVTDARLAMIRAVTGSVVVGLVNPGPQSVALALLRTLRYISHGYTFDVAVTAATERNVLLSGELEALNNSHLPRLLRVRAKQYRRDLHGGLSKLNRPTSVSSYEHPSERSLELVDFVESASRGRFDSENFEATEGANRMGEIEERLDEDVPDRVVQAMVSQPGQDTQTRPDNVIRPGANLVEVFVGPQEAGALLGPRVSNRELGLEDESVTTVRLTVVLVPMQPTGNPVRAELDVPRTGRSETTILAWNVPNDVKYAQARIVLLHRNRVIQTAVLSGNVGGPGATLEERIVLWPDLAHLDDRRPCDLAFVMNHNHEDQSILTSFANDQIASIPSVDEISKVAGRIRDLLVLAAGPVSNKKARREKLRLYLAQLSVHGRELHRSLQTALGEIGTPQRIQILTARPSWLLPLEFVYDRPTSRDARLCQRWLDGQPCGPQCFSDENDQSVVCPSVFWGLSRVIERYYVGMGSLISDTFWVRGVPSSKRSSLTPTHAALAASYKVKGPDVTAVAKTLGAGVQALTGWDAWKAALASTPTDLLVLLPHSDPDANTLEIARTMIAKGEIEAPYVTGGQNVTPIVILFGCDTSGFTDDPAGYAGTFMQLQAGLVFSTFTMILGSHAARMSQRLVSLLMDPQRTRVPVGELLTTLRNDLAREGLLAGLSITAYGNSEWKV